MRLFIFLTITCVLTLARCRPAPPDSIPLPTKICVRTQHHGQPIPAATVYLKYNTDTFPGYDQPASFYDATFKTGADSRGCLESVPEGKHWIVAFGYDSLHFPHEVYGSLRVDINLTYHPVLDTIMYVSE